VQFVLLGLAIFAIILVRGLTFFDNAHTATMLPNTAAVTLDEQSACVFGVRVDAAESFTERWSGVVLVSTDAARYLLFIGCRVLSIALPMCTAFAFGRLCALAATRWLAHLFARPRMWRR